MTKELEDRLIGVLRRVCTRGLRAVEEVTHAGGQVIAGRTWGREASVQRTIASQAAELRELAALLDGAATMIDEPSTERTVA